MYSMIDWFVRMLQVTVMRERVKYSIYSAFFHVVSLQSGLYKIIKLWYIK